MQHYLLAILIFTLSPLALASNSFSDDDLDPLFRRRDLNPEEKAEFQKYTQEINSFRWQVKEQLTGVRAGRTLKKKALN